MKTIVALFALIITASLCLAAGPVNVTSVQAKALMARNSRVVLLDVRTPEEYRQAHLRGALLIPLGELAQRVQEIPPGRPLLIYCAVGARSVSAADFLASRATGRSTRCRTAWSAGTRTAFPSKGGEGSFLRPALPAA